MKQNPSSKILCLRRILSESKVRAYFLNVLVLNYALTLNSLSNFGTQSLPAIFYHLDFGDFSNVYF